jgi:phosphoribosylformylglycinamidine synthase
MIRGDALLFSESQSRIIVSLKEENVGRLREIAARHKVPMQTIGAVGGARLVIHPLLQVAVEELKAIWFNGLAGRVQ